MSMNLYRVSDSLLTDQWNPRSHPCWVNRPRMSMCGMCMIGHDLMWVSIDIVVERCIARYTYVERGRMRLGVFQGHLIGTPLVGPCRCQTSTDLTRGQRIHLLLWERKHGPALVLMVLVRSMYSRGAFVIYCDDLLFEFIFCLIWYCMFYMSLVSFTCIG